MFELRISSYLTRIRTPTQHLHSVFLQLIVCPYFPLSLLPYRGWGYLNKIFHCSISTESRNQNGKQNQDKVVTLTTTRNTLNINFINEIILHPDGLVADHDNLDEYLSIDRH